MVIFSQHPAGVIEEDFSVGVIISDATYQLTKDIIVARPLKEITVKGRAEAVMTYEVTAIKGEDPSI